MEKQAKSRKPLLVGVIVAVVVLAALLALLLTQCFGGQPDGTNPTTVGGTTAPDEQVIDLYWNADRANYMDTNNPDAGVTNRPLHEDGYYHVVFAHNGEQIDLPILDRRLLTRIDSGDLMTLVFDENGVVIDATLIDNLPVQVIGANWYIQSMGGTTVKINSSSALDGMEEVFKYDKEKTKIYDMSGISDFIGAPTFLQKEDCLLTVASEDGKDILYIFVVGRAGILRTKMAYCQHCKEEKEWQNWYYADSAPNKTGHYYLETDIELKKTAQVAESAKICLDLDGYTITGAKNQRVYTTFNAASELAIMDTSEAQTGTLKAQGAKMDQGGVLWARYGIISVYGGTYDASAITTKQNGTCVCVEAGAMFNLYGGKIVGGTAVLREDKQQGQGGAVCVRSTKAASVTFNMYGGEIVGGKSESQGGNIYVYGERATFNMYGGTIRGGTSLKSDAGNLFVTGKAIFNLSGGTITGGTGMYSGNICINGGSTMNMTGGTITGGMVRDAQGVYNDAAANRNVQLTNSYLNMYGGRINGYVDTRDTNTKDDFNTAVYVASSASITGAAQGHNNLKLGASVIFKVGSLSKSAKIGVSVPKPGTFSANAVKESVLANITSDKARYGIGLDAESKLTTTYDAEANVKVHCICGDPNSTGTACAEEGHIQHKWYIWIDPSVAPFLDGFWYLDENLDLSSANHIYYGDKVDTADKVDPFSTTTGIIGRVDYAEKDTDSVIADGNVKVYVDLNGYTITGKQNHRIWRIENKGGNSLTITDTSADKAGKVIAVGADNGTNPGMILWHQGGSVSTTIYAGTFDASRAAIVKWDNGGALALAGNTTIYGGTIIGAKGEEVANATIGNTGKLVLNGINDSIKIINTAKRADAFRVNTGKRQEISGSVQIDRIYLNTNARMVLKDLTADTSIGVDAITYGRITATDASMYINNVHAVDAGETVKVNDDKTLALVGPNGEGLNELGAHPTHCVCGGSDEQCEGHGIVGGEWLAWDGTTHLTDSGNYYLENDITDKSQRNISAGVTINLCLNGHSITSTGRVFYIADGATVNIMNCSKTEGNLVGSGASDGSVGSVLLPGKGVKLSIYDGVNIYTAKDAKNACTTGGAVHLFPSAELHMYGGTITGREVKQTGGAVHMSKESKFYLHGGVVSGGTSNANGGGNIYIDGGIFVMTGGKVTGGTAVSNHGGNIYARNGASATILGGVVSDGVVKPAEGATAKGDLDKNGGNIAIVGANTTVTIGGTAQITGGTGDRGGNIFHHTGILTIQDTASITGGKANNLGYGGGGDNVHVNDTVKGGEDSGTVVLAGTPTITELKLISAFRIDASGMEKGGNIGINRGVGMITGFVKSADVAESFHSVNEALKVVATDSLTLALVDKNFTGDAIDPDPPIIKPDRDPVTGDMIHCICGKETELGKHCDFCDHDVVTWKPWTITDTAPFLDGYWYLSEDLNLDEASSVHVYYDDNDKNTDDPDNKIKDDLFKSATAVIGRKDHAEKASESLIAEDVHVYIDLHGRTLTTRTGHRAFRVDANGEQYKRGLTITDTYGGGRINASDKNNADQGMIILADNKVTEINIWGGTLNAYGITVAANRVGGAAIQGASPVNLYGGTIIGGTALGKDGDALNAGMITLYNNASIVAGGGINGSVKLDAGEYITLDDSWVVQEKTLTIRAADNYLGMVVKGSLTPEEAEKIVITNLAEGYEKVLKEDGLYIGLSDDYVDPNHASHCYCGKTTADGATCDSCGQEVTLWLAWTDDKSLPKSGHYYLTKDVTVAGTIWYDGTKGYDLKLDLNGHTVTMKGRMYVYNNEGGSANLTITDCAGTGKIAGTLDNATVTGGIIHGDTRATINIYGGTLDASAVNVKSGAVMDLVNGATLNMYGGKLIGGTATNGGAIYAAKGKLNISGDAQIVNGDVVVDDAAVKLAGKPTVQKIYLQKDKRIDVAELEQDANIGIALSAGKGIFTNAAKSADVANAFHSTNEAYEVKVSPNVHSMQLVNKGANPVEDSGSQPGEGGESTGPHIHCYCGETTTAGTTCASCGSTAVTWTEWTDKTKLPTSGNYYLTVDVNMGYQGGASGSLALDLNGHTVTGTKADTRMFYLYGTSQLTITDCSGEGTGKLKPHADYVFEGNARGAIIRADGNVVVNLYGGILDASGTAVGVRGAAIDANNSAKINIYGGTIKGGTAPAGGAVYLADSSSLTMTGGTIEGGTATNGGAIYAAKGNLNISGDAEIINGDVVVVDAAVKLAGTPTVQKIDLQKDMRIDIADLEQDANIGIVLSTGKGTFTTVAKSADVAKAFHSEEYDVKANSDLTLYLADKESAREPVTGDVTHCICGAETELGKHCDVCDHDVVTWKPWTITDAAPFLDGYWYLSDDLNLTSTHKYYGDSDKTPDVADDGFSTATGIIGRKEYVDSSADSLIAADVNVYIDLDGRTLTTLAGHRGFRVDAYGSYKRSLTITDTYSEGGGKIVASEKTNSDQGMIIWADNTVTEINIWGGTLDASKIMVASGKAGGAAIQSKSPVNMYGGTIIGGKALGNNGDALNVGTLTLYNDAAILNGTGTSGAVYLDKGEMVNLDASWTAQTEPMTIRVANGFEGVVVKGELTAQEAEKFSVVNLATGYELAHKTDGLYIEQSQSSGGDTYNTTHCFCNDPTSTGNFCADMGHLQITWQAWTNPNALPTTSTNNAFVCCYLTTDVTLSASCEVSSNAMLAIDLNGKTISSTGNHVFDMANYPSEGSVSSNASSMLIITDTKGGGKIDGSKAIQPHGRAMFLEVGSVYLFGGTITGDTDASTGTINTRGSATCTFNMYGGTIEGGNGNPGGALHWRNGTFNMYGGEIKGGTALTANNKYSGNVDITGGTFNMYGGKISGGQAKDNGGNVGIRGGAFNMEGGEITGGTADIGGDVYLYSGSLTVSGDAKIGDLYIKDGMTIAIGSKGLTTGENGAKIGVTMKTPGVFTSNDVSAEALSCFTTTQAGYKVGDSNGKAALVTLN